MKKTFILLFYLLGNVAMSAQGVSGMVSDMRDRAVEGASVVLQTADSLYIEACVTNAAGRFSFKKDLKQYRLIVQHLSYKTQLVSVTNGLMPSPIRLEEKNESLKEVIVKADYPIVRVSDEGALVYNVKQLIANRPVTNALDLLEEIPGIVKEGENLSIVGAGKTTIIINGHKRSMSWDDLKDLLASTPPSQVKKVELFYNASPRSGVKGGAVNVVMNEKRSQETSWNGSAHTDLYYGEKYYQTGGANVSVFQRQWQLDFGYGLGSVDKVGKESLISNHQLSDRLVRLDMYQTRHTESFAHQFKVNFNYEWKNKDRLSLFCMVKFANPKVRIVSPLYREEQSLVENVSDATSQTRLHTLNAEYVHKRTTIGGDYIYYNNDNNQSMDSKGEDGNSLLLSNTLQKVHKGNFYFNQGRTWGAALWTYGFDASVSSTDNRYRSLWSGDATHPDEFSTSTQNEYSVDVFAGWVQSLGRKMRLTTNFIVQYYHADMERAGVRTTLWNGIHLFPSITCYYKLSPTQSMVFTFSGEREYPGYFATRNTKSYSNAYFYYEGNPSLKPSMTYDIHLNYILKNKYVFGLFANMAPDKYTQQIYQSPTELQASYQWVNFDSFNAIGALAVTPHRWNAFIDSKLTAKVVYVYQAGHVKEVSFDREKLAGQFSLTNNFILNRAKTFSFQWTGFYQTAVIQGIYDNKPKFDSSAAFTWSPKDSGWNVTLKASDLFNTSTQKLHVDRQTQHYAFRLKRDVRLVSLSVRYLFNGYKQKKERKIDTSRLNPQQ